MNILFLTAEVAPFAKTGGLGDVSAALPRALHRNGHDVRVFLPLYARVDQAKAQLRAVESLQNVRVPVGPRTFNVRVFAAKLPGSDLEVYFLHCPELYGRNSLYTHDPDEHVRFLVLSYGALICAQRMRFAPDIIHCNDWQTALVPLLLRTRFSWDQQIFGKTRTVLTIHNLGYQGVFSSGIVPETGLSDSAYLLHQDQLRQGQLNSLLHGILYANALTTVSPTYANEIRTTEYGAGLDGFLRSRGPALVGILNGVDYEEWNPETDRYLPARFSAQDLAGKAHCKRALLSRMKLPYVDGVPLFAVVSRLAGQKGLELLGQVLPRLFSEARFQVVVLGSGERRFERMFWDLQHRFPANLRFHNVFDNGLAHQIEAAADFFLMPSRYEPCGLNQLYSLRYGAVPIVRKTGGLADTVRLYDPNSGMGTGIVFEHFEASALRWAMQSALRIWRDVPTYRRIQQSGMAQDYSWDAQVRKYEQLYSMI